MRGEYGYAHTRFTGLHRLDTLGSVKPVIEADVRCVIAGAGAWSRRGFARTPASRRPRRLRRLPRHLLRLLFVVGLVIEHAGTLVHTLVNLAVHLAPRLTRGAALGAKPDDEHEGRRRAYKQA